MICPQCHQVLREEAQFCDGCGTSILLADLAEKETLSRDQPSSPPDPWVGKTIGNKYQLVALLGTGGMGAVYLARRTHIGDRVAIKVLHKEFVDEPKTAERFRREAQAAALLRHPTVVAIYDFSEARDDEPAYIVMELIEGKTLRKVLETDGAIEPQRAVALMLEVCKGVGVAHRHNVVHRDIKPDNIMVLTPDVDDGREQVKVVDFGIAKLRDMTAGQTLTQPGRMIGTVYYMSPEQCCAEHLDARSDVYSLGVVLYEMLVGAPPFVSETGAGIVAKHLSEPPPAVPERLNVPAALVSVVMSALAKEPKDRPIDASALREQLIAAIGNGESLKTLEQPPRDTVSTSRPQVKDTVSAGRVEPALQNHDTTAIKSGSSERSSVASHRRRWLAPALVLLVILLIPGFILVRKFTRAVSSDNINASGGDPKSWRSRQTLKTSSKVYAIVFSPDNQMLVTASSEALRQDRDFTSEINFWNTGTGELQRTITEHGEGVLALAFSPDGNTIAGASGSGSETSKLGKVKVWDAHTGSLKWAVTGHTDFATAVAFSPDGHSLASGSLDHTVKLWDAETGALRKTLNQNDKVHAIAFAPQGRLLAIAGQKAVELWDFDNSELKRSLYGDGYATVAVAFSVEGSLLASGDVSGKIQIWDVSSGTLKQAITNHTDVVDTVSFSPDGKLLVSGSYDSTVIIWNIQTATKLATLTDNDKVTATAFSRDGRTLASGGWAKTVHLWQPPVSYLASPGQ